jgi:hypothetical protein
MSEIEQLVKDQLNEIRPDNIQRVVDQLSRIELRRSDELDLVVKLILGEALVDWHGAELYADVACALGAKYPEFPPDHGTEKAHTFKRTLVNSCQDEFERMVACGLAEGKRHRSLAMMKFIGNLFLRGSFAVKVIDTMVRDLLKPDLDLLPPECMVEHVCEMLRIIGCALQNTKQGRWLLSAVCAHLSRLQRGRSADGSPAYCSQIQLQIQELLDLWDKPRSVVLLSGETVNIHGLRDDFPGAILHHQLRCERPLSSGHYKLFSGTEPVHQQVTIGQQTVFYAIVEPETTLAQLQ